MNTGTQEKRTTHTSQETEVPAEAPTALKDELQSYIDSQVEGAVEKALENVKEEWASEPQLWSIQQAADYLNISARTLDTMIASGEIEPIWIKGQRRFDREAIFAYVRSNVGKK